jgi:hypothetical protein
VLDRGAKLLGDDRALDRLKQIGMLYAAARGGGALSTLLPSLGGIADANRLVKASGIAGTIAPEGAFFDAAAGRFRDLLSGQFVAGEAGGLLELLANPVTLAAASAAAVGLVEALVAVAGAMHALLEETSSFHAEAVAAWNAIEARADGAINALADAARQLEPYALELADSMGVTLLNALAELAREAETVAHVVTKAAHTFSTALELLGFRGEHGGAQRMRSGRLIVDAGALREAGEGMADALSKRATVRPGAGGGGGGVHVARVEITVATNQDPNRIARIVAGHLADLARYRKSSAYVPNFSASR